MTMMVMLSPPIPCVILGSSLIISSSISVPISVGVLVSMRSRTYFTAFSFVRQSQIPSHPKIMKSSSGSKATLEIKVTKHVSWFTHPRLMRKIRSTYCIMSGSAVMIWSGGGMPGTCLYFRSPIDRERFKLPFTRPKWFTKPPADIILVISRSCCGLWSKLNGLDWYW